MQHLSEEQLVLYHYAEGGVDRGAAAGHLAICESCQASYEALQAVLATADATPVPERSEAYGRRVWARIESRLERPRGWQFWSWSPRQWAAAGAFAVLVVAAFLTGRSWPRPAVAPAVTTQKELGERILLVAVGDHLERSQMVLVELANAQPRGKAIDISAERLWAEDLVGANRLYRLTAARAGDNEVADLLEELEPFLIELVHSPERLSAAQIDDLRERLERQGILFKVRVIRSQIQAQGDAI